MALQHVNIAVSDGYLDVVPEVTRRLEKAGLHVERQLAPLGIVTGSIDSSRIADLERVPGVDAVEAEHAFQLPPSESPFQ